MPYAIYISTYDKRGWSKFERHGATEKKPDAIRFAKDKKARANHPQRYRIRKIKGTQGYANLVTGETHLPMKKSHTGRR
ncbi:MAG: hypothetical protein PHW62_00620 [Candidatus Ratteibacteria bacterium]|nr:hypothetical protein [Candidatus Ratteibacteria bacterium]